MKNFPAELSNTAINELRDSYKADTVRATSSELEEILYKPFPVLDHGFIRVIDYMGTDASIVQAARVSYGIGTKKSNEDQSLINYLMRHQHTTPFEMCEIKLHVKLPIFVARQWIRHRTANVNEYSARYSILNKEFYIPELSQLSAQSTSNKQGKNDEAFDAKKAMLISNMIEEASINAYDKYSYLIEDMSLARELARSVLPVNYYTEWYWKIDLHNLMHFLRLRSDSHAQYEIRCYANIMLDILKKWLPFTYEAFVNYKQNSIIISPARMSVIKRMLSGEQVTQETSGLSKGEWSELQKDLEA